MPYLPPAIVGLQVFGFQNSISPYGWCSFWRFSAAWERSLGPRPIFKIQRKRGFPSEPRFSDLPHDEQLIETCSLTAATWWRTWPSVGPLQGNGTWVVNVGYLITRCSCESAGPRQSFPVAARGMINGYDDGNWKYAWCGSFNLFYIINMLRLSGSPYCHVEALLCNMDRPKTSTINDKRPFGQLLNRTSQKGWRFERNKTIHVGLERGLDL